MNLPVMGLLLSAFSSLQGEIIPLASLGESTSHGEIIGLEALGVDDFGHWTAYTRFRADGSADHAIVRDGHVILTRQRVTQTVDSAENFFVSAFYDVALMGERVVSVGGVTYPGGPPSQFRGGVCIGTDPVLTTLDPPGPPFGPTAVYYPGEFGYLRGNSRRQFLALSNVSDPLLEGTTLQLFETDGRQTTSVQTIAVIGECEPVVLDLNEAGQVLYGINQGPPSWIGRAEEVRIDGQSIAIAGGPTPLAGTEWLHLSGGDLNDNGDHVLNGFLLGAPQGYEVVATSDRIVALQGESGVAVEGGTFLGFSPYTSFSPAPRNDRSHARITNLKEVVYFAFWRTQEGTLDNGLLVDDERLVRSGDVLLGISAAPKGVAIRSIGASFGGGFVISPNGRYVLFDALLEDEPWQALCLIDRGQRIGGAQGPSADNEGRSSGRPRSALPTEFVGRD